MANTIASAVRYINNDAELNKLFEAKSYTQDLVKPNVAVGAKTVNYRQVSLGSTVLGSYNRATGYTATDITVSWVTKALSQDKGNSLKLDKMDSEEAQALEIATVHNKYINTVVIPAVDTYRLAQIAGATGVTVATTKAKVTKSTVEAEIDKGLDTLFDLGATGSNDVILYIKTSAARFLKQAAKDKGTLGLGSWNGSLEANVLTYGDAVAAKVVQVPDALFPASTNFILVPATAVAAMVKYQENEYFDRIPGFGGRLAQVDSGIYHDCWVEPGAEAAVYVSKEA